MKYKLEYEVADNNTEGTARPVWYVVITNGQRLVRKQDFPFQIMSRIIGPFSSRENAEKHRKSRIYAYGEGSVVFCQSAYYSDIKVVNYE